MENTMKNIDHKYFIAHLWMNERMLEKADIVEFKDSRDTML